MTKIISEYKDNEIYYNHETHKNPQMINFDIHTHDICELIFLKSGNPYAVIGEKTYKLTQNSLMIFRANIPHRIKFEDGTDYERYDILFDENKLANQIFNKIPKTLDLINCSGNKYILDLFEKLDYYCENFEGNDLKKLITNIIEELIFNMYLVPTDEVNGNLIATHPIISSAIEYINEHYREQLNMDEISRQLCITKSHFHHLFVETMQITPKKYINIKRVMKAQQLIRMGGKPAEICFSCGFNDYGTFFRNYTAYFGYNPSEKNKIPAERKIES